MWDQSKLLWIDLSYNYLTKIEDEIVDNFPNLKTFYFHGNYVENMEEVRKLGKM